MYNKYRKIERKIKVMKTATFTTVQQHREHSLSWLLYSLPECEISSLIVMPMQRIK